MLRGHLSLAPAKFELNPQLSSTRASMGAGTGGWPMHWVWVGGRLLALLGAITALLRLSQSSSGQAGGSFVWRKHVSWHLPWVFSFYLNCIFNYLSDGFEPRLCNPSMFVD